jgi:hypothetical protein
MYMLMSSGPLTDRKLRAHSVATALASSVLPVPALGHDTSDDSIAASNGISNAIQAAGMRASCGMACARDAVVQKGV